MRITEYDVAGRIRIDLREKSDDSDLLIPTVVCNTSNIDTSIDYIWHLKICV